MSKFRKVAATPVKFPWENLGDVRNIMKLISGDSSDDIFNQANMKQNLSYLASLLAGWTDRYSPSAFYHALETDKNRGYNDTKHSQGAFEMTDPKLLKAIEDFKKNPPKNLKDLVSGEPVSGVQNISVPESSNRYQSMREKLNPSTANSTSRFIKTSDKKDADELIKIIPKWTIEDVLADMAKVASKKDLPNAEKQLQMTNILSQYEKSIAPLSQYLEKNGIQPK
jgi:hypothetical protein